MDVADLKPNATFDVLEVEVTDLAEPREFSNFRGSGRVSTATCADATGSVKFSLWNEQIDQVKKGDTIIIEGGWVKEYRGELQVSTGRSGKLTVKE